MLDLPKYSDRLVVARLAHLEVTAAIIRRGRESTESFQNVSIALAALDSDVTKEFQVVEFSDPLIFRAIELAKVHALRAADAIQLACALLSRAELPSTTEFFLVSADDELNAAAAAEGLQVENPNVHP